MKYFLLFIVLNLAIISVYADFDDKGKLKIEKMGNHMKKIQGYFRNLEPSDEPLSNDESTSNDDDNDSPELILPTTPKPTNNRRAHIQVIGFNTFKAEPKDNQIKFRTFITFVGVKPGKYAIVYIAIKSRKSLRYLDDDIKTEPADCIIDSDDENKDEGNARYDCSAPKDANTEVDNATVLNVTFNDSNLKAEDISFSEEAALAALQLSNQTQEINNIIS